MQKIDICNYIKFRHRYIPPSRIYTFRDHREENEKFVYLFNRPLVFRISFIRHIFACMPIELFNIYIILFIYNIKIHNSIFEKGLFINSNCCFSLIGTNYIMFNLILHLSRILNVFIGREGGLKVDML